MTISASTSRNDYIGAGSAGPFAFGYRIFSAGHLEVIRRSAAAVETTLAYPLDFTISVGGVGNRDGGSITLSAVLAVGESLTIRRKLPITQGTDLRNLGAYLPETIEDQLDQLVMIDQQQQETLDRSIKLKRSLGAAGRAVELEPTAGKVVMGDGTGFIMGTVVPAGLLLPFVVDVPTTQRFLATVDAIPQGFVSGSLVPGSNARFLAVEAISGHAHYGFLDKSVINYAAPGVQGHASFACFVDVASAIASDHHHPFQDLSTVSGAAVLAHYKGYQTYPIVSGAGGVTEMHGFWAGSPLGVGPIGTYYGFYTEGTTGRAGVTYAFFSLGAAPSQFGGPIQVVGLATMGGGAGVHGGDFSQNTGLSKTVAGVHFRTELLKTTGDGANYAALLVTFTGAATAAARTWNFQTIEAGVANAGIIRFQPNGGTVECIGELLTSTGSVKTAGGTTSTFLQRSTEAVNYAAIQVSFSGNAAAALRTWTMQTIEAGVASDGILRLQPNGGTLELGSAGKATAVKGTFAMNGKAPIANVAAPAAAGAAYTAAEQTLLNDIRTRLINLGVYT